MRIEWMPVALAVLVAVAACGLTEPEEPDTTIRVQGTVTEAADGSPIAGATVEAFKMSWSTDELIVRGRTDNQGRYSLSFIEAGYCPESLFKIKASKDGFQPLEMTKIGFDFGHDPTYIRCTEEIETINFQLEPAS